MDDDPWALDVLLLSLYAIPTNVVGIFVDKPGVSHLECLAMVVSIATKYKQPLLQKQTKDTWDSQRNSREWQDDDLIAAMDILYGADETPMSAAFCQDLAVKFVEKYFSRDFAVSSRNMLKILSPYLVVDNDLLPSAQVLACFQRRPQIAREIFTAYMEKLEHYRSTTVVSSPPEDSYRCPGSEAPSLDGNDDLTPGSIQRGSSETQSFVQEGENAVMSEDHGEDPSTDLESVYSVSGNTEDDETDLEEEAVQIYNPDGFTKWSSDWTDH